MGYYTEFVFASKLKKSIPKTVIDILEYMVNMDFESEIPELPEHNFFQCERWHVLFVSNSYYFSGITNSIFKYDDIPKTYFLTVRSNLKNYDNEIRKFLNWIEPYIYDGKDSFLGYWRGEESEKPHLIYSDDMIIKKV